MSRHAPLLGSAHCPVHRGSLFRLAHVGTVGVSAPQVGTGVAKLKKDKTLILNNFQGFLFMSNSNDQYVQFNSYEIEIARASFIS